MVYILWIMSLIVFYYFLETRKKKRIGELRDLIDKLQHQDYRLPMRQDDFSILEDAIYKLFIEIVEAKETTARSSDKQVEYLEDIAHQIKTPITGMVFSVENLELDYPEDTNITILKKQILRLNSLSDILLKLSSLDANKNLMKKEDFTLEELVNYCLESLNMMGSIQVELSESLENHRVVGDFYWLSEAIINILKNASNRELCSKISIKSTKNPLYTSLFIEDDGGGIAKENMRKIFKRFYKTPDSNGFGIGLAMAKSIVEKNNGGISVENTGSGACFIINFYNVT
ncbi:HAMP domain-containing sensor histidine kinase [Anaerococcus sp. AGMB09787]|uniref:sensor histidine kinase n=1 Tax=Anaerococcus sp. AGMB09787 TaxID=2922869 RepID=UPI001FAFF90A|nr:HAMP domain-containing sensor histidine kinase [Anaerococcus sp. AGMB09787]